MDLIDKEIDQIPHRYQEDKDLDNLCIRFIRKKFKCIVIFLLFFIALLEFLNNIVLKIDENLFKNFIYSVMSDKHNESLQDFTLEKNN